MAQAELPVQLVPFGPHMGSHVRGQISLHTRLSQLSVLISQLPIVSAGDTGRLPCAPASPGVRPHASDRGWRPLGCLLRKQERRGEVALPVPRDVAEAKPQCAHRPAGPSRLRRPRLQCGQRSESKRSNWHPAYLQRKLFTLVSNFKQINESLLQEILALK